MKSISPDAEVPRIDTSEPVNQQLAIDRIPAFDEQINQSRLAIEQAQAALQRAYKLSWETKQNCAGIVLLDLLQRTRTVQRELEQLASEIQHDR
jgi:hypothetical protein